MTSDEVTDDAPGRWVDAVFGGDHHAVGWVDAVFRGDHHALRWVDWVGGGDRRGAHGHPPSPAKAASRTLLAIGPARRPPVPAEISSSTGGRLAGPVAKQVLDQAFAGEVGG